jgi:hypothetical protein
MQASFKEQALFQILDCQNGREIGKSFKSMVILTLRCGCPLAADDTGIFIEDNIIG